MPNTTRITSKGQVTIPKHVRDRRSIAAGTEFEVTERGEEIVLRRREGASAGLSRDAEFEAYIERVRGTMNLGMSTDEFMELLRGE